MMKLGLGLYKHMLTRENFDFAKQAGASHIVAHLVDYFRGSDGSAKDDQPLGSDQGWGLAGDPGEVWTVNTLVRIRKDVEDAGLKLEAIENFDPAHWHAILLDGCERDKHVENVRQIIRNVGLAEIPIIGYNFSLAGVAGRTKGNYARGGAESVGMEGPYDKPMYHGMVWNMVYDRNAPAGTLDPVEPSVLWDRLKRFLDDVLPVAEEVGVSLALHPDDPPMPTVRGQPRLVYQPDMYQHVLELHPSPSNKLELCIGSLAEMTEGDIYSAVEHYARQRRIGYVHLRNVRGKVPHYKETFIDEGDVDILDILGILGTSGFDGVIIPDHAPQMSCQAPWHAGMAFAMGYIKAGMQIVGDR